MLVFLFTKVKIDEYSVHICRIDKNKERKRKEKKILEKNALYVPELSEIWGGQERDEDR